MHVPKLQQAAHAAMMRPCPTSGQGMRSGKYPDLFLSRRWACAAAFFTPAELMLPNEADDIAREFHGFVGDGPRPVGTIDEDGIDIAGVRHQPLHLGCNRRQFFDAKLDQRILETRELPAEIGRA